MIPVTHYVGDDCPGGHRELCPMCCQDVEHDDHQIQCDPDEHCD